VADTLVKINLVSTLWNKVWVHGLLAFATGPMVYTMRTALQAHVAVDIISAEVEGLGPDVP